jgi:hypothetical protein
MSLKAPILVSNHLSFVEGFYYASDGTSGVGKLSMLKIPLFSWALRALEVGFVALVLCGRHTPRLFLLTDPAPLPASTLSC